MYYTKQGASPLSIRTLTGGCPRIPEGPEGLELCARMISHSEADVEGSTGKCSGTLACAHLQQHLHGLPLPHV